MEGIPANIGRMLVGGFWFYSIYLFHLFIFFWGGGTRDVNYIETNDHSHSHIMSPSVSNPDPPHQPVKTYLLSVMFLYRILLMFCR